MALYSQRWKLNPQYAGQAVTPFIGILPVSTSNPFPIATPTAGVLFAAPAPSFVIGDNTIVAAVAGFKIRCVGFDVNQGLPARDFFWKSGAATRISSTAMGLARWEKTNTLGLFETAVGQALVLNASAATASGSCNLTYILLT